MKRSCFAMQNLQPIGGVDKEDMKKLKEEVFGQTVFWVTDVKTEVMGLPNLEGSVLVSTRCLLPSPTFHTKTLLPRPSLPLTWAEI